MLEIKTVGKLCAGKTYARFDEEELVIEYDCDNVTLTDERVRNSKHKLQPVATMPVLYSTACPV
ncbi:MAG: hypothetical protein MRK02_15975 [Candidatus Scalindua sp.]|nr:hypothetical protein [Candidatus Scalindua sp.]